MDILIETTQLGHNRKEYSVSEISSLLKRTIELNFSFITIRGEVSGLKIATSGHVYFALKDQQSVLSAVCWKGLVNKLSIKLEEGMEILCTGTISIFSGQSKYQLMVEQVELAGRGSLMLLLEKRKKQLESEGLFDRAKKKKIPFFPQKIGIITSLSGAVIKDILHRITDRCPSRVIIWPVLVQGEGAAAQISNAINGFNKLEDINLIPDVIIVARGGGSIEDFWAFNEEIVVRSAANSKIPIISAVGHETDTTLIDFASDLRAPTPTAAAEFAVPILQDLYTKIYNTIRSLHLQIFQYLGSKEMYLQALSRGLISPRSTLFNLVQKLDDLGFRLDRSLPRFLEVKFKVLKLASAQLPNPSQRLSYLIQCNKDLSKRLKLSYYNLLVIKNHKLILLSNNFTIRPFAKNIDLKTLLLDSVYQKLINSINNIIQYNLQKIDSISYLLKCFSYQKTLERGYVILMSPENEIIDEKSKFLNSQQMKILFKDGEIEFNK